MPTLLSVRRAVRRAAPLAIVTAFASRAHSQTLGGQVVQLESKKPLGGASVALVNDSARVVASTAASSEGSFYLDAPTPGGYRVVLFVSGASFVSPALQLDSGKTVERQFSVPDVPETFTSTPFARDVTTPAAPIPGSPRPAYPKGPLARNERALVSTMFVVGANGQPDMSTFRVLSTTDAEFVLAVRDALHRTRFVPADKDGSPTAQVVQYTYDFGFPGDADRGDVMIRPAVQQQTEAKTSHGKYVILADELSKPDVAPLSLLDAMKRLRPSIFRENERNIGFKGQLPSNGAIYVNGILADGSGSLLEIRAGQVEEVRYWPREEAAMKFGMDYTFGITVKLRAQ